MAFSSYHKVPIRTQCCIPSGPVTHITRWGFAIPVRLEKAGTGAGVRSRVRTQETRNPAPDAPRTGMEAGSSHIYPQPGLQRIRSGHSAENMACTAPRGHTAFQDPEHMPEKNPEQKPLLSRRGRTVLCPGTPLRGNRGEEDDWRGEEISAASASWSGTCLPTV